MGLELTEDQLNTVKIIAENEGICSYVLDIQLATLKGDGYSGSLWSITLIGEANTLNLILKEAERTENVALRIFRRKSYLREMYVYNSVLKEFKIFQRENNILDGFTGFAKIYRSNEKENNEYLILENLKECGYKMWNRRVPMNTEHLALVFLEYGKFHAVSLAMREKRPHIYQKLTEHLGDFYSSSLPREDALLTIQYKLQIGLEAVKDNQTAAESFKRFVNVAEKFLLEDTEIAEDKLVVTHSDCWCNNILFKYKDTEDLQKPNKVCFIDWQLSKTGSPVLDLAYFFFACTAGENLQKYEKFLKIYHKAVSDLLTKFSCNVEKMFPYTLLERHWKKYAKYGLYTALMTINLTLRNASEISNEGKPRKSKESTKGIEFDGVNIKDRNQRIIDIINFMAQHDLI